jgi:hypothetical protein
MFAISNALATDEAGGQSVRGYGGKSCGAFISDHGSRSGSSYATWLTGYITAVNELTPDTYSITGLTDLEGVLGWVENYCKKNPTDLFFDAVKAAVLFLNPKRLRTSPH